MTNFVNLKINTAQSFRGVHSCRMCVHVFIGVNARIYISMCIYIMFLRKNQRKIMQQVVHNEFRSTYLFFWDIIHGIETIIQCVNLNFKEE
jgi:hypothetical protein